MYTEVWCRGVTSGMPIIPSSWTMVSVYTNITEHPGVWNSERKGKSTCAMHVSSTKQLGYILVVIIKGKKSICKLD